MKKFSSELGQNYETYTFGYTQYAKGETGDSLSAIYQEGYLPYSGAVGVKDIFYMARSARILLPEWEMSSENRRIAKKFDGQFKKERVARADFKVTDEFLNFCIEYFSKRHGEHVMPRERLELILNFGIVSHITTYTKDEKVMGYVFEAREGAMGHYWYSFYDSSLIYQSLGLWLMLDCLRDAKAESLEHYYLGTVYKEKALYKSNFEPMEWWDGEKWNTDLQLLKEKARSDQDHTVSLVDEWKKGHRLF